MAIKSRRARRSGGSDPNWKKSKGLAYLLIAVIGVFWIWMLFFRDGDSGDRVHIPQAYYCVECKQITEFDKPTGHYPPHVCAHCGARAAWPAYTCTECVDEETGKPPIFAVVPDLPEGVGPPAEGEEPNEEYMDALMEAEMEPPECPICGKSENVVRYMTPKAKEILDELRKKAEERRKNK